MRQVCASLFRRTRGRRAAHLKNPYKGEKRKTGWGGSLEGTGGGEERGIKGRGRRERETLVEFARFIPPPVFKLRPDVSLLRLFYSPFDFSRRDHTLPTSRLAILPSKQRL